MYFVMATSNVSRFTTGGRWAAEAVALDPAHYPFLARATVLDFTSVKAMPLVELIEPRVLPLITPGGYF